MKVKTRFEPPPIPVVDGRFDWSAWDDETYTGDPGEPLGFGPTEAAALADLKEQAQERGR